MTCFKITFHYHFLQFENCKLDTSDFESYIEEDLACAKT